MEQQHMVTLPPFISIEERTQLVRFCTTISGRTEIAEDLVQETLLEAWRHEQALRDPSRRSQWLTGIARNVYLRWRRKQVHDEAHRYQRTSDGSEQNEKEAEQLFIDDYDIELDLERRELLELLDRALALLPEETRTVLLQHYIHDMPLKEVAQQLGTNTNALAVRMQRGKRTLRHLLTQDMQKEFIEHRQLAESTTWEVTPLWCYRCGQQRLLGKKVPDEGKLLLKCPTCCPSEQQVLSRSELPQLKGMKSYKPMLTKLRDWSHKHYRTALDAYFSGGSIICETCGRALTVLLAEKKDLPDWLQEGLWDLPWVGENKLVNTFCLHCETTCNTSLSGLISDLPESQAFAQEHPRMRILPTQVLEITGRSALLTCIESVTENATLTVISDAETYAVLGIEREGC